MYLKAATLDDLLEQAFRLLLKSKMGVVASKGSTVAKLFKSRELFGSRQWPGIPRPG